MKTFAITSGKGGVGKTNLAVNLGIALAQRQKRVVLFDADLGLANVDVVLGARAPYTLQHVLAGEKTISEIIARGPGGLHFIAGGSGIESLVNLSAPQLDRFLSEVLELESHYDILLFDTGAGVDENVMTFLEASDEVLLITTPDPASITDAYATAKLHLARKPSAIIRLLLNMVTDSKQAEIVYGRVNAIALQFLSQTLHYLGCVRYDASVAQCVRKRQPFILSAPNSRAAEDVHRIASRMLGQFGETPKTSLAKRLRSLFSFSQKQSA